MKPYMTRILLVVPLMCFSHLWLYFSPSSNNSVIEVFLFILRYGVAVILKLAYSIRVDHLLVLYSRLLLLGVVGLTFWLSNQEFAAEVELIRHRTATWNTFFVVTLPLQIAYGKYILDMSNIKSKLNQDIKKHLEACSLLYIIPYACCALQIWFNYTTVNIYYCVSHATLLAFLCLLLHILKTELKADDIEPQLDTLFLQNVCIVFTLLHQAVVAVFDLFEHAISTASHLSTYSLMLYVMKVGNRVSVVFIGYAISQVIIFCIYRSSGTPERFGWMPQRILYYFAVDVLLIHSDAILGSGEWTKITVSIGTVVLLFVSLIIFLEGCYFVFVGTLYVYYCLMLVFVGTIGFAITLPFIIIASGITKKNMLKNFVKIPSFEQFRRTTNL